MPLITTTQALLKDKKAILKKIHEFGKTAKAQDELAHLLGCSVMKSFISGNTDLANELVKNLGRSANDVAFVKWFCLAMPASQSKEGVLSINKDRQTAKDFKGVGWAVKHPFWNFKAPANIKQFTLMTLIKGMVARSDDRLKECGESGEMFDKTDIDTEALKVLRELAAKGDSK